MKRALSFFLLVLASGALVAQESPTVRVIHRFDWRRSVNAQYQGLVYGYMTGAWKFTPASQAGWSQVEARYYLVSESRRNNALLEKPVDAEKVSQFLVDPHGTMSGFSGDSVPYYRNFPAPLPPDVGPGSVWTGTGEVVGDFLGNGIATRIPILIEYRWQGPGTYGDRAVVQVKTQYALRYPNRDPQGDPALVKAEGTRIGVVSYDASSHDIVFIRETAKEQFTSKAGQVIGNDGILLTFFEGVPALGKANLTQTLAKTAPTPAPVSPQVVVPLPAPAPAPATAPALSAGPSGVKLPTEVPDVTVEEDPRGVKLTLDNLKFAADQAILLPGEEQRLTALANLLKTVPGRNLLIVGHTAAVGSVASQESLSVDRALSIVSRLKALGIPASSLLYEGRGGREPVASNDTDAGRAQNRRVEIIILDQ